MLPAPLPHPLERRVRATGASLPVLQDGFQLELDARPGDDLQDFRVATHSIRGGLLSAVEENAALAGGHRSLNAGSSRVAFSWSAFPRTALPFSVYASPR